MGHVLKIYYSMQNGGDGSAYPYFFTTEELADWDQRNLDEGWGEPCVGELIVESASTVFCREAMDAVSYWLLRIKDEHYEPWDLREEYLKEFFPDGLPQFEVTINGKYYDIFVCGFQKGKEFVDRATESGRRELEERLNKG